MFSVIYLLWREEEFIILALLALMTAIIWKERGESAEQIVGDIVKIESLGMIDPNADEIRAAKQRPQVSQWQSAMPIQNFIRGS